jgi:hypothetical protein
MTSVPTNLCAEKLSFRRIGETRTVMTYERLSMGKAQLNSALESMMIQMIALMK